MGWRDAQQLKALVLARERVQGSHHLHERPQPYVPLVPGNAVLSADQLWRLYRYIQTKHSNI